MRRLGSVIVVLVLVLLGCSAEDAVTIDTDDAESDSAAESAAEEPTADGDAESDSDSGGDEDADGDEAPGEVDELTAAVGSAIQTSIGAGAFGSFLDEQQSICAAQRAIDEVGRERLADIGLESPADAVAFFDGPEPPVDVQIAFIDAVAACGDQEGLVDLFTSEFPFDLDDEARTCMAGQFADDDVRRPFIETIFANEDAEFEELPPEAAAQVFGFVFDCIEFGDFVSALVAEDGGSISEDSIDCLNEQDTTELFAALLADPSAAFEDLGTSQQAEFLQPLLDCLSAEELLQLGG